MSGVRPNVDNFSSSNHQKTCLLCMLTDTDCLNGGRSWLHNSIAFHVDWQFDIDCSVFVRLDL